MFHPLAGDFSHLKDNEVEEKLLELNKKYHAAARLGSRDLLTQLSTLITMYREELKLRYTKKNQQDDDELGQLINVD
jgi:hypothetical protein